MAGNACAKKKKFLTPKILKLSSEIISTLSPYDWHATDNVLNKGRYKPLRKLMAHEDHDKRKQLLAQQQ